MGIAEDRDKWLSELKVGDTVIAYRNYNRIPVARVVHRLTKTQIIINDGTNMGDDSVRERKFRKDTGHSVGNRDSFLRSSISKATPELIERAGLCELRDTLKYARWEKVPLEKLRKIKLILEEEQHNEIVRQLEVHGETMYKKHVHHVNGKKVGEIDKEIDGYYYFWPNTEGLGYWTAETLAEISAILAELNADWKKTIERECEK